MTSMAAAPAASQFLHSLVSNSRRFSYPSINSRISLSTPALTLNSQFSSVSSSFRLSTWQEHRLLRCSAVQDIAAAVAEEKKDGEEQRRKLYVVNLPWTFTAPEIEKLFSECGTVKDVEIIKQKNGKSRGFTFITMAAAAEATAAVEKFDSYELMGRIIRVELAKSFRKPSPALLVAKVVETRHKIYASNLAWKVRSTNLRSLFSSKFNPVSVKVVFDSPTGRSAGYGFVSFATKEEAEAAVSEFDGKELMGRPLRLRINEKKGDEARSEQEVTVQTQGQSEES